METSKSALIKTDVNESDFSVELDSICCNWMPDLIPKTDNKIPVSIWTTNQSSVDPCVFSLKDISLNLKKVGDLHNTF